MNFTQCSSFSFGKTLLSNPPNSTKYSTPGPGAYSPSMAISKKQTPQYKFGTSPRTNLSTNQNPGPGSYHPSPIQEAPSFSFYGKTSSSSKGFIEYKNARPSTTTFHSPNSIHHNILTNSTPHIQSYTCFKELSISNELNKRNTTINNSPKYVISNEKRNKRPMTPGPGEYEVRNITGKEMPMYSFGKEERGMYYMKGDSNKSGRTVIFDIKSTQLSPKECSSHYFNFFPGPGAYSPNDVHTKYRFPTYRIGTAKRKGIINSNSSFPAPNLYHPNYLANSTKPKSPSYKIGSSHRDFIYKKPITPGPGDYNIMGYSTSGINHTFRTKNITLKLNHDFPFMNKYHQYKTLKTNKEVTLSIEKKHKKEQMKRIIKDCPVKYKVKIKNKMGKSIIDKSQNSLNTKIFNKKYGKRKIIYGYNGVNEYKKQ